MAEKTTGSGEPGQTTDTPTVDGLDEVTVGRLIDQHLQDDEPDDNDSADTRPGEDTETSAADSQQGEQIQQGTESKEDDDEEEPAWFRKRIDKLTAARRSAEEEVEGLRAKVEELQSKLGGDKAKPAQKSEASFDDVETLDELEEERKRIVNDLKWCSKNRDGGVFKRGDGQEVEFTSEQVEDVQDKLLDALHIGLRDREKAIKQRLENDSKRSQYQERIYEVFPFWKDKESKEYKFGQQIFERIPALREMPDGEWHAGIYLLGIDSYNKQIAALKGGAKPPASQPPRAPSQPKAPAASPARLPKPQREAAILNRIAETGGESDVVEQYLSEIL